MGRDGSLSSPDVKGVGKVNVGRLAYVPVWSTSTFSPERLVASGPRGRGGGFVWH